VVLRGRVSTSTPASSHSRWIRLRGDVLGGMTAAIVMLAIEGSYGLIAFGWLGPDYVRFAFLSAIWATALSNLLAALFGARGPLLGGPSAALVLLMPPLAAGLLADPRLRLADGQPDLALLLALLWLGVALSGVLQVAMGALRLGGIVRYVPYTVQAGFMNAVAVLMVVAIGPHLLGLDAAAARWQDARPLAVLVAAATAWIALRPPAWTRAVPSHLTALLAGTALHHGLRWAFGDAALGPALGMLSIDWPAADTLAPLVRRADAALLREHAAPLLEFALAVALMSGLQTLLAGSVIDGLTRVRRDAERELLLQGVANIGCGLLGALPTAGAVSRSKLNLDAGGSTAASRIAFAVCLVGALALAAGVLQHLPMAAIAGVFLMVAYSLIDPWSRRATALIAARLRRGAPAPRSLLQSYAVMLLVAGTSVLTSLAHGVALGVLMALLMFVRSHSLRPVRSVIHADHRSSLKVRTARAAELLRAHGRRIALLELDGALFFGTADAVAHRLDELGAGCEQIVVDFRRVREVDASGARVLVQAAAALRVGGRRLLLASLEAGDARRQMIEEMDLHGTFDAGDFFPDADRALESAEDQLLDTLEPDRDRAERARLPLADTMLAAGMDAEQVDALASLLVERRFAAGEAVFRRGDASDALFVAVLGAIGIWLPADTQPGAAGRRIVSYAPGVVFGEMGLLQDQPRSADAIAEDDAVVLVLTRAQWQRLAAARPELLLRLMTNLTAQLSTRIRRLTDELQAALDLH
jgi:SulP family sulfate permease